MGKIFQNCKISERIKKDCYVIVYVIKNIGYFFKEVRQYGSFKYKKFEKDLWKW